MGVYLRSNMAKKRRVKIRKTWRIDPRTRVKESSKRHRRSKTKRNLKRVIKDET